MNTDQSFRLFKRLIFSFLLFGTSALAADEYVGQAVSVAGKVLVRGEGTSNVQMTFLKPGDKLYKGSIVNTGSNGVVKLLMTDRTIVDLGPSSLFKVNEYQLNGVGDRKVDMSLDYGQVRASVNEKLTSTKGKFTIRTKAATMGVRGTEFVVRAPMPAVNAAGAPIEPPKTSLTVMHGKVEVADSNSPKSSPVAVTPGFQFSKSGEGPGSVANLGMDGVAKVKAEAYQKDMTFMQTVSFDSNTTKESNSSNSGSQQQGRSDDKSAKSDKTEKKTADSGPSSGGQKTLENIGLNIATQAKEAPPPTITDLRLPGTFTPEVIQPRPIDMLNGRMINVRVKLCPAGQAC